MGFFGLIAVLNVSHPKQIGMAILLCWLMFTILFEIWQMWRAWTSNALLHSKHGFFSFVRRIYLPSKWLDTILDIVCGNILTWLMVIAGIASRVYKLKQ